MFYEKDMKITQRILVTGAAGFLGSHLCERLLKEGYEVVGVDNFLTGQKRNISELDLFEKFSFVEGDICDGSTIFGKMGTGFSSIFHLASPASPVDYTEYPLETLWVNAAGTKNILEFARLNSAQVIFASTSEVYGDPQVHPQREDYFGYVNSVGPRSCYDEGKRFAESLCWNFSQKNRVPIKIARIFNTYGPRMAVTDGRVVSEFFRSALTGKSLVVFGEGHQTRSFCYVSDLVQGLFDLAFFDSQDDKNLFTLMNLGNDEEISVLELAKKILELTGSVSKIEYMPVRIDEPFQRRPDLTYANKILGYRPVVNLEQGLKLALEYFQSNV